MHEPQLFLSAADVFRVCSITILILCFLYWEYLAVYTPDRLEAVFSKSYNTYLERELYDSCTSERPPS